MHIDWSIICPGKKITGKGGGGGGGPPRSLPSPSSNSQPRGSPPNNGTPSKYHAPVVEEPGISQRGVLSRERLANKENDPSLKKKKTQHENRLVAKTQICRKNRLAAK